MKRPNLEKIKKQLARTTEGKWQYDELNHVEVKTSEGVKPLFTAETPNQSDAWVEFRNDADAEFFAEAKQIVKDLLTYIEELEK